MDAMQTAPSPASNTPVLSPSPQPDRDAILEALDALFISDDVIELRSFSKKGRKCTTAGYFDSDHREALADAAISLNKGDAAVYVTLNRIDPQLIGRYSNRVESYAVATATDANVIRRRWLLIDFDPVRPKETSATNEQLEASRDQAKSCYQVLKAEDWPEPLAGESGNGYHLLYPVDLPNDTESRDLVKGVLAGLAQRFDTEAVTVDQAVFNAGRITKLYGTVATKGDHTPLAPWRVSRLVSMPSRDGVVTPEQMKALQPANGMKAKSHFSRDEASQSTFDLPDFLTRLGIPYDQDSHEGSDRYKLEHCPFNSEHTKGEAAIFQHPSGSLGFKCMHNSCIDNHWQEVRALVDGPRETRERRSAGISVVQSNNDGKVDDVVHEVQWADPDPLPRSLVSVDAFDELWLPESIRPWVADISERIQCPPDFPAVGAMVSLANTLGRKIAIRPKQYDDWMEVPNLWGAVVGRPGIMKSPALSESMRPLHRLAMEAQEQHKEAVGDAESSAEIRKAQVVALRKELVKACEGKGKRTADELAAEMEALKTGDDVDPCRRFTVNDATVEKLGELLAENPEGLLMFRDELVGWLRALDRDGSENARPFFLESWNGMSSYTYDRIGRGTLHIDHACLGVLGGIQPGPLSVYVRGAIKNGQGADGLLQRIQMLVWPDDGGQWKDVDRYPASSARDTAYAVFRRLSEITPDEVGAQIDEYSQQPWLRFDTPAQELFTEWRNELENTKLRSGEHEVIESHLSKYRKLIPALALVIHLTDNGTGPVTEPALIKACAWGEYLESHARRVYAVGTGPDLRVAHALLDKIKQGRLPSPFKPAVVYHKGWAELDKDGTYKAIDVLVEHGWLAVQQVKTGGRPSTLCHINPAVLS